MNTSMVQSIKAKVLHVISAKPDWSCVSCENLSTKSTFSAVGTIPSPVVNKIFEFTGAWTTHPRFGRQFAVTSCFSPDGEEININREDIIRFLASNFIKGLNYHKACLVYETFGDSTFLIIEHRPDKLTQVPGIGNAVAQTVHESFVKNKPYWKLRAFLKDTVTDYQIRQIHDKYGDNSISKIRTDPYRLIDDIDGIGFKKADVIAKAAGIEVASDCRVQGAVIYLLQQAAFKDGHCYSFHVNLSDNLNELIGDVPDMPTVAADAIKKLQSAGRVVVEKDGAIFLKSLWEAESEVALYIKKFLSAAPKYPISKSQVLSTMFRIKSAIGFDIEDSQRQAVEFVFRNTVSIITGGPGTGKTTIIKAILHVWTQYYPIKAVRLMAPTGKASRRITEVSGIQAYTIHQTTHKDNEDVGLVIVDEGSMIDITVAKMLFDVLQPGTRVVIIGDANQLPSIGPGNFFSDLLSCYTVPSIQLKVSFRQHGAIARNAELINDGVGTHGFIPGTGFEFMKVSKEQAQKIAMEEYLSMVQKYGVKNVCLLTPKKVRGSVCTNTLNPLLQDLINPLTPGKEELALSYVKFREGDRVLCEENIWRENVANGDVGVIQSVSPSGIVVLFDSGVELTFSRDMLSKLSLAYSMTIHKCQGSEFKGVILVFTSEVSYGAQRNLLYTAVTRAKEDLKFIGDPWSIMKAISNTDPIFRNTKLKDRLLA